MPSHDLKLSFRLFYAFSDDEAEKLYSEYCSNEKRSGFKALLAVILTVTVVLLGLYAFSSCDAGGGHFWPQLTTLLVACLFLTVMLLRQLFWATAAADQSSSSAASKPDATTDCRCWWTFLLPLLLFLIQLAHVSCDLWLYAERPRQPADAMVWLVVHVYTIYALFPVRFRYCCSLVAVLCGFHILLVSLAPSTAATRGSGGAQERWTEQLLANVVVMVATVLLGIMSFFFNEKQQRKAFLETCQSLEVKLVLEEEAQEQERLLLSVLPQHVADEIKQDLGTMVAGQFKKIYMSRHENVSILFADIVGFTAFSSTCPAPELVKTLNELFARFDKLAEKYHQLRIKILGDCYYCISGAPEERSDHAVLSVHMGLSMVDVIKTVREATRTQVDMRVGIHTGAVLAGVMGQRQWQFDVYSKDVELANKMESGGLPGKVHISEKTLSFLDGEFEICDGNGGSREEAIRLAGIKTYLVSSVIKPWPEGTLDAGKEEAKAAANEQTDQVTDAEDEAKEELLPVIGPSGEITNLVEYNRRLRQELLNRDFDKSVKEHTNPLTAVFYDAEHEHQFTNSRDATSCISLLGLPITLIAYVIVYLLIGPAHWAIWIVLLLSNLAVTGFAIICNATVICNNMPEPLVKISNAIQKRGWLRLAIVIAMVSFWIAAHIVANVFCDEGRSSVRLLSTADGNMSSGATPDVDGGGRQLVHIVDQLCPLPHYLNYLALMGMLAVAVLVRINHLIKVFILSGLLLVQIAFNITTLQDSFRWYDIHMYGDNYPLSHAVLLCLALGTVVCCMYIINRQFDLVSRRLFLWQKEVEEQKEKVGDMRKKNEALVYNILPPHVALLFIGRRKRDEELYSKSYEAVGVMFAAMPNFSDFYTEESVNNQGLECLRVLNEVISDYDALLGESRFKDIIKIKTIGSTYMAASGLDCDPPSATDERELELAKWNHLVSLVEFCLALKETLSNINKESFNNFVLKIGLNHGPITAGVIGAKKPHFDMWGNTVNVASRMESTGKAGSIQVVEETKDLLEKFGYHFEQRGMVAVKGKGMLKTFYLKGKS